MVLLGSGTPEAFKVLVFVSVVSPYLSAPDIEGGRQGPVGLTWATRPFLSFRAGIRFQVSNSPVLGPSLSSSLSYTRGPYALEKGNLQMG